MKLKLSQLKKIIKEEVSRTINESSMDDDRVSLDEETVMTLDRAEAALLNAHKALSSVLGTPSFKYSPVFGPVNTAAQALAAALEDVEKERKMLDNVSRPDYIEREADALRDELDEDESA